MGEALPCPRHPGHKTYLRCSECEAPVCPKCMVPYEVGYKCPACAGKAGVRLGFPRLGAAFASGLVFGSVYAQLYVWIIRFGWLVGMLISYAIGFGMGRLAGRWIRYGLVPTLSALLSAGALLAIFCWQADVFLAVSLSPGLMLSLLPPAVFSVGLLQGFRS